jgi:hypothetical protein
VSYYAMTGNQYAWHGSTTHDVIGDPPIFNVWGIDVTDSSGDLTFDLYTNFNHDGYYEIPGWHIHAFVADFAIDVNPAAGDGYEYAVVMRDHGSWTVGADPGNAYTIGLYEVDSWHSSSHFFNSSVDYNKYAIFGGGYMAGGLEQTPSVAISSAIDHDNNNIYKVADVVVDTPLTDVGSGYVITPVDFGDGVSGPKYRWSFTINDFNTTLGLGADDEFGVFWGGATCANDTIIGTASSASTPEPTTLLLTGFGLMGLAVIGISKHKRRLRGK